MNNQQAVVEQIIQKFAFEVEAIPKDKTNHASSISQNTPMNVKIRVRKKEEKLQQDISSVADDSTKTLQKIRLVSSDQTIMSFDVFMEAEFEKEPTRKPRKNILDILKPGKCLKTIDDNDYPYKLSSSYSAILTEPSVVTRSDGVLKQNFTLSKNTYDNYTVATQAGSRKSFFGKCKPGGCLDPPFSEDKYSYQPSLRSGHEPTEVVENSCGSIIEEKYDSAVKLKSPGQSNGKRCSIFDGGILKSKRKSSNKSTDTKIVDYKETDSVLSIYKAESIDNSSRTHSNSIITYPPTMSSDLRISGDKTGRSRRPSDDNPTRSRGSSDNKTVCSRGINEDKTRKSFNDHSELFFVPQKKVNKFKDTDLRNQKDDSEPSDVTDSINTLTGPLNLPEPIPIPIPLPTNLGTGQRKIKDKIQINKANIDEMKATLDQESIDKINKKSSDVPGRSKTDSVNSEFDDSPIEFLKLPDSPYVDINLDMGGTYTSKTMLQPDSNLGSIIYSNDPCLLPQENNLTEFKISSIPIPIPLNLAKSQSAQTNAISSNKIGQSQQLLNLKGTPQGNCEVTKHDTVFGKRIDCRKSTDNDANANNLELSGVIKSFPKDYLRAQSELANEESDTSMIIIPTIQDGIRRDSNSANLTDGLIGPTTQNYTTEDKKIKLKDTLEYLEDRYDETFQPSTSKITISHTNYKNLIPTSSNLVQNEDPELESQYLSPESYTVASYTSENNTSAVSIRDSKTISNENQHFYENQHDCNNIEIKETLRSRVDQGDAIENESDKLSSLISDSKNDSHFTKLPQDNKLKSYDIAYPFDADSKFRDKGSNNVITAAVIIDKIEQTPQIGQLNNVYSKTNLIDNPGVTGYQVDERVDILSKFADDDDDNGRQSAESHEMVSAKSVLYKERYSSLDKRVVLCEDTDKGGSENISNKMNETSNKLSNQDNVKITSILSSTSTLKSSMKKDTISVEFAFHSYLNDKNERILRTFDAASEPMRLPNDSIANIKSEIRLSSNEIRIPVDSDYDLSLQIKKANTNQRVSISQSGLPNTNDKELVKQKSAMQTSGGDIRHTKIENTIMDNNIVKLYEQELVPLRMIIKNLKEEIDVLAAQQLIFNDKICCPAKSKLPRLIHSNKKCVGCLKK